MPNQSIADKIAEADAERQRIANNIEVAYNVARSKGATMPQAQNSANLAATINSISGGQQVNKEDKDVNFFDYDGTVLYTYTAEKFYALTELPSLPQHDGLVANGWTYALAEIIDYLNDGQTVDVGIYYETDNGNTRLHLLVENNDDLPPELPLYVKIRNGTLDISVNGVQSVSETESANSETNHTILVSLPTPTSFPAKYTIDISFTGDGYYTIGQNSVSTAIFGDIPLRIGLLESAEIGNRCRITANSFYNYFNMKSIVLPSSITKLENYTFYGCSSLNSVVIPEPLTDLGEQTFRNCVALKRVVLSKSITSIKYCDFYNCVSLRWIIIPENVNTCGSYVFYYCTSLKKIKLSGITSMGTMLFSNCFSLESVASDGCTTLNANIFADCVSLREIKLSGTQTINAYAFSGGLKLFYFDLTAYTDSSSIPTLAASNALQNTPNTQVIYVSSQAMLEAFSNATNWSTYASRFEVKP
ncbi:leucine-rich repeat protein [Ruminococcus sp.]|uniref:leucine-rich repeat domain-containing protein n=1 Tax=Ruminococcus sp. TaxID=41978 RepID=UPI00388D0170